MKKFFSIAFLVIGFILVLGTMGASDMAMQSEADVEWSQGKETTPNPSTNDIAKNIGFGVGLMAIGGLLLQHKRPA